jgi:hypothetical protein
VASTPDETTIVVIGRRRMQERLRNDGGVLRVKEVRNGERGVAKVGACREGLRGTRPAEALIRRRETSRACSFARTGTPAVAADNDSILARARGWVCTIPGYDVPPKKVTI